MPETTLQAGIVDTALSEDNPSTNYGSSTTHNLGFDSGGDNDDILIKFDLSSISKGSKIQKATLSLYVNSIYTSVVENVVIWRVLQPDWTEDGATWDDYDGVNPWGTAGAESEGVDISTALLFGPTSLSGVTADTWEDFELNTSVFQALIDAGNNGMKLGSSIRNPTSNRWFTIRTSEHATSSTWPKLYVRWIEPSGRLYEYKFNKFDKEKRIVNSSGKVIRPNELRPDTWIFVEGTKLPIAIAYDSLVVDPRTNYIVGVSNDEDGNVVGIEFNRDQFADQIIARLTRGV